MSESQAHTSPRPLQYNLPDGGYMIADDVLLKTVQDALTHCVTFYCIINISKLSPTLPLSTRQAELQHYCKSGMQNFVPRNLKSNEPPGNAQLFIESFLKTAGDGTVDGPFTITNLLE